MHLEKVFEILAKHIIKVEEDNQLKDWEIERLKEKLNNIEEHLEKYSGGKKEGSEQNEIRI